MSQNRNLSIHADFISGAGLLNTNGGGLGVNTTPSNGQIPIGNGTNYTVAAITAGTGITVTNAAGSITIASSVTSGQFQNQLFTSSGTWTAPTNVTKVRATVVGGGGGSNTGGLGGFGGIAIGIYTVTPGTGYTVTVGSGANYAGGSAGTSSFSSFLSATGGTSASGGGSGSGGSGSGGNLTNSYSNGLYSYGAITPFTNTQFASGSNTTSARAYSTSPSALNPGAGAGGDNGVTIGGVGGIVFLEWVG